MMLSVGMRDDQAKRQGVKFNWRGYCRRMQNEFFDAEFQRANGEPELGM